MRRIFYSVGLIAGATVMGLWLMLTQRLGELGVDVWTSRAAMLGIAFFSVATIGVEEAAGSIRSRIDRRRSLLLRPGLAEAGQISMSSDGGELSVSPISRVSRIDR